MPAIHKVVGALAVFGLIGLVFLGYLVCFSPNRGYYRVRLGLVKGKPFRIHGRVIDQYGQPVLGYEMHLSPFFEQNLSSWTKSKVGQLKTITDSRGRFVLDSSPLRLTGTFYGGQQGDRTTDGQYYHASVDSGGDIFFLNDAGVWMRDARHTSPVPLPHDEKEVYIIRVGHSGPPQRMISFDRSLRVPPENDYWFGLNILTGELKENCSSGCDINVHMINFENCRLGPFDSPNLTPYQIEYFSGEGVYIQFAKDSFRCEAPPAGYQKTLFVRPSFSGNKWILDDPEVDYGHAGYLYFMSHDGNVYGKIECDFHGCYDGNAPPAAMGAIVKCVANPRGSGNLNYNPQTMEPLPLPMLLPYRGP